MHKNIFLILLILTCRNLPGQDVQSELDNITRVVNGNGGYINKKNVESISNWILNEEQDMFVKHFKDDFEKGVIKYDTFTMPFYIHHFNPNLESIPKLIISMHGGGGAPAHVNDQQYQNQQHLYDDLLSQYHCIYVAPRAPTNNWNLWHESHIDPMFEILIKMVHLTYGIDRNQVYLTGYSAGGDGTFQLAPRMADFFAGAAMMAGHPNNASPVNLRNLPFAIQMGGKDDAYSRNVVAAQWKSALDTLSIKKGGYPHKVDVYPDHGHWMHKEDTNGLKWILNYNRSLPDTIHYFQNGNIPKRFYWVKTYKDDGYAFTEIRLNKNDNSIDIDDCNGSSIDIFINDKMLDMDKEIIVRFKGIEKFKGTVERDFKVMTMTSDRLDKSLLFSGLIHIDF